MRQEEIGRGWKSPVCPAREFGRERVWQAVTKHREWVDGNANTPLDIGYLVWQSDLNVFPLGSTDSPCSSLLMLIW